MHLQKPISTAITLGLVLLCCGASRALAGPAGELEALVRTDRFSEAVLLGDSLSSEQQTRETQLWLAIASKAVGEVERATSLLSQIANDPTSDTDLRLTALANLLSLGKIATLPNDSITVAINFIEEHSDSPLLEYAFNLLELRNGLQRNIVGERLKKWSQDQSTGTKTTLPGDLANIPNLSPDQFNATSSQRAALANYYLGLSAIAKGEREEALSAFEAFIVKHPDHQLTTAATIRLAEAQILLGRTGAAEEIITALRQQNPRPAVAKHSHFLEARLLFVEGRYDEALDKFLSGTSGNTTLDAPFNAAIAAIYAGDSDAISRYGNTLSGAPAMLREEGQKLETELILESGLFQVARADAVAFTILESFITEHPDHPRVADAELALAELYLNQVPAQPVSANEHLQDAAKLNLTLAQRETLDYIAIWVQESAEDIEAATSRAILFLQDWPHSPRRAGIMMKLGQVFYRAEDYETASQQFELLFTEQPNSPLAEAALFFAAKAAAAEFTLEGRTRAKNLWDQVVTLGGPLAAHARHEQGLLAMSQDRIDDAIEYFEGVFELVPTRDLRIAVLCDKGQAAFTKARAEDNNPEILRLAIDAFVTVEKDRTATRAWHFQAAVRRGKCLEALGEREQAFETYISVINAVANGDSSDGAPGSSLLAEADWAHRAGFAAIRILESQESWEDAIKIADFLAQSKGPRATEAGLYAERVRLEQFIWDK